MRAAFPGSRSSSSRRARRAGAPSRRIVGLALIVLPWLAGKPARAQEAIQLRGTPSCQTCRILVRKELTLGGLDAPGVGQQFCVARDAKGRFFVSNDNAGDEVGVYGPEGEFLRTLGRSGQGPGEWSWVNHIVASRDEIHLFDSGNARGSVFDLELNLVRTAPLPGDIKAVAVLADSSLVVNALFYTPELIGYPLHTVDLTGRVVASFGYTGEVFRRDQDRRARRKLSASGDHAVWAAHTYRYLIERWTVQGEKRLVLDRAVGWYPDGSGTISWNPENDPPPPSTAGLWEDGEGLLWVVVIVPDPDWRVGLRRAPGGSGYLPILNQYHDTMIEVISPSSGEVLAAARLDAAMRPIGGGRMIAYREDENGIPFLDVFIARLERGERNDR